MARAWRGFCITLAAGVLAVTSGVARGQLLGPSTYLSSADSPFAASIGDSGFFLEDFEDGTLDTLGVSASAGAPFAPGGITDSVDADDGTIDGVGTAGWSYFSSSGSIGISFTFDETALGGLPTQAGIVWTDGLATITFEAFDENGVSLGTLMNTHADASFTGGTAEDRFYGVTNATGISRIHISNSSGGIEVDHLQYGNGGGNGVIIPEPTTLASLGLIVGATLFRRR